MTPQERTELQRLAEALKLARTVTAMGDEAADSARLMASALIAFAAEAEELRAENERLFGVVREHERARATVTEERDTALAALESAEDDRRADVTTEIRRYEALESRYTALVKAAREVVFYREYDGKGSNFDVQDFITELGAPLDSEASGVKE